MRPSTFVLLSAILTVSTSTRGPAAQPQASGEIGAQYDRFGRLVYSPTSGRHVYDDSERPGSSVNAASLGTPVKTKAEGEDVNPEASTAAGESLVVTPEWFRIAFGQGNGLSGLHIADIDVDGDVEIVSSHWSASTNTTRTWQVLSREGSEYVPVWQNLPYADEIASVRVAQVDADPALEVLVGVANRIEFWDGASRTLERTVTTGASRVSSLSVADVDADGAPEIVFCDPQRLYLLDLATGTLEFEGQGLGGQGLDVGQADADPALEIAVANGLSAGSLVDGQSLAVEWSQPGGFGNFVRLADLDGDDVAELVAGFRWYRLVVYDTTSRSVRYEVPLFNLDALRVADVEGDGAPELLYGDAQWGTVHVLDGVSGAEKWKFGNLDHGVTDIAVGDADGDGVAEIVWGAGHTSSGPDHLFVGDSATHAIEWQSLDESGGHLGFAFGDVDADGTLEVVHTSSTSDSGYEDGLYFVHDAVTKALEYRSGPVSPSNATGVWRVRVANLDADPQLELLVTSGTNVYQGAVYCFDGLTHEEQWRTAVDDGQSVKALAVADLEGDGTLEVVAGTVGSLSGAPRYFVYVLDGATGALEWRRQPMSASWGGGLLRVANVDDDGQLEIVLASHGSGALEVVDGLTHEVQLSVPDLDATALDVVDRNADGRGEIVVGNWKGEIHAVDPVTGTSQLLGSFGTYNNINGLAVTDLTGDGTTDLVFCVADRLRVVDGASGNTFFVSDQLGLGLGAWDSLTVADVDADGTTEIVVNLGLYGIVIFSVEPGPDSNPPVVSLISPPPGAVSGTVQIEALASDDRGVAEVEFYVDGVLLGADATAPYTWSWSTPTASPGAHVLLARARDATGNVGTSPVVPVTVLDQSPPSVQVTHPSPGSTVSGTVTVAVSATDDVGVARVDFYVDATLRSIDTVAPYLFAWDTTTSSNGGHSLYARAYDAAGNSAPSPTVGVVVSNAVFDSAFRAPLCATVQVTCDSGTLLLGRGPLGPEPNQPNTLSGSCPDGTAGIFHSDESNDRIQVSTMDGSLLATGKLVRVSATVWAWGGYTADKLDLYSAADASNPVWTHRGTLSPTAAGSQVLTTTFVLPRGSLQAVRARFRYQGTAGPCGSGSYNDHDDLVFAVEGGSDEPPVVSITSPADGATVAGSVGISASASDDSAVVRVEFLVDGQVRFTDATPPDWLFPGWDTRLVANGYHTLVARAYDVAGNVGQSPAVTVTVQNPQGNAGFDPTLRVPVCTGVASVCDSGALLVGRNSVGPEPNQPNTIGGSCADSPGGTYHSDESNDRLVVRTVDGTAFAPGKLVRVEATVWGWSGGGDYLDLYHTGSAASPAWVPLTTLAVGTGAQTLTATYTLPAGGLQAVRARLRYLGAPSPCSAGAYTDHDDLVFAVQE
jgi:hypothetical protein